MPTNINISSLVSPDILKNISSSTAIKTLGDQLKDQAKEKVISSSTGKIQELKNQIEEITKSIIKTNSDHGVALKRLDLLLKEKQITQEEYEQSKAKENASYELKQKSLKDSKKKLETDLNNIIADPYNKIKEKKNKRKLEQSKRKSRNKAERTKAKRDLTKKVVSNTVKTLAPIITLQLTNQFSNILFQRKKLEELVNQVNNYIDTQVKDAQTVIIATNLRNNAVSLINNNIKKIQNIENSLKSITPIITVFSLIITILSAIPIPTAVPPGIGIPLNIITKIQNTIQKASKLISALSVILAIANVLLSNEIIKLNELRDRLKEISLKLDKDALNNLDNQQLSDLTSTINQYPPYKGFNFKIKEEQNQQFVVKGNKRKYAVAIDRDGVEVIKSDYSFTLDPQDLVDQLKLIIDQRDLQG